VTYKKEQTKYLCLLRFLSVREHGLLAQLLIILITEFKYNTRERDRDGGREGETIYYTVYR
jgi:hypothetical protein